MLDSLFYPRSIAVIGASHDKGKVGYSVLHNLKRFGYEGRIFGVNPKAGDILGTRVFPDIHSVDDEIDLAIVVIPAQHVAGALRDCADKGVRSAVIISSGFREGGAEGAQREEELKAIVRESGMHVVGPNCLGIINTFNSLNATFAAGMLPKGRMAFFSQSGALGIAILDWAIGNRIGFSKFISLGNKADLNETDFIEYFIQDPETDIILGYVEDVVEGRRFLRLAKEASRVKPIILVKSGGTRAGARAASSHTGALAGSDSAFDAAFRQTGIIRAGGIEDLFETAKAFSCKKVPAGNNLLIVTNAGGPGIIAADTAEKSGIALPALSREVIGKLSSFLPKNASLYNPVDIIGDASADRYSAVLEVAIEDSRIDGFLVILTPQATISVEDAAEAVMRSSAVSDKPFITCFMGEESVRSSVEKLKRASIPNFSYPEPAVQAFRKLRDYGQWVGREKIQTTAIVADRASVSKVIREATEKGRFNLTENESRMILGSYGFRFPARYLATDPGEAAAAAEKTGFPVVMKVSSPDILHKTDVGGVKLGIRSKKEAKAAFTEITLNVRKFMPSAFIEGISVYEAVPGGKEVITGITYDRTFGHMIMFGLGGIYVEILKDVSFRIVPLDVFDAREMVHEIRSFPLLKGTRGEKPVDIDAIVEAILRLSALSCDFPGIQELDINPLVVTEKETTALDARIIVGGEEPER
ncbi:MAG: acetate--CoA ligase family protein [Candidatus Sulfobium sp.]